MDPKDYSAKVKAGYRLVEGRDGDTIVLQRVARVDVATKQAEYRFLPLVPIEELLPTIKQHYDGSMGINTLYGKVSGSAGLQYYCIDLHCYSSH